MLFRPPSRRHRDAGSRLKKDVDSTVIGGQRSARRYVVYAVIGRSAARDTYSTTTGQVSGNGD